MKSRAVLLLLGWGIDLVLAQTTSTITTSTIPPSTTGAGTSSAYCSVSFTTTATGSTTTTISTTAQATALTAQCGIFTDTIEITQHTVENLELSAITTIAGDLRIFGTTYGITVSLPNLVQIGGTLFIQQDYGIPTVVTMGKLSTVNSVHWQSWTNTSQSIIGPSSSFLEVQNNTQIINTTFADLSISLGGDSSGEALHVADNPYLERLNLAGASDSDFYVSNNGLLASSNHSESTLAVNMTNVLYVGNLYMDNVAELFSESLGYAQSITIHNSSMGDFEFPSLTRIDDNVTITNNPNLDSVSFSGLQAILVNMTFSNNPALVDLSFDVTTITGVMDLEGSFTSLDFGNVRHIDNNFTIKSDQPFDCQNATQASPSIFGGSIASILATNATYTCTSTNSTTFYGAAYTSSASSTPSKSGLSPGAQAGIGVGVSIAVLAILAAAFLLWRRRQKQRAAVVPTAKDVENEDDSEHGFAKAELDSSERRIGELAADRDPQELSHSGKVAPVEMASNENPATEMSSKGVRAELAPQEVFEMPGDSVWRRLSRKKSKAGNNAQSPVSAMSESQKSGSILASHEGTGAATPPTISPVIDEEEHDVQR